MIVIKDETGTLIRAPLFPGWAAIGLDQPKRVGDVYINLSDGNDSMRSPDTSMDMIHHDNEMTPRQCGDDEQWCVYRRSDYIRLAPHDRVCSGDIAMMVKDGPPSVATPGTTLYDGIHFMGSCTAATFSTLALWRAGTPSPRPSSVGNLHYQRPYRYHDHVYRTL